MESVTKVISENIVTQKEELLALKAIYGDDAFWLADDPPTSYVFAIHLPEEDPSKENGRTVNIQFSFPTMYPSHNPPIYVIDSVYFCGVIRVTNAIRAEIHNHFMELFTPGEVVLFAWMEWLKDYTYTLLAE